MSAVWIVGDRAYASTIVTMTTVQAGEDGFMETGKRVPNYNWTRIREVSIPNEKNVLAGVVFEGSLQACRAGK